MSCVQRIFRQNIIASESKIVDYRMNDDDDFKDMIRGLLGDDPIFEGIAKVFNVKQYTEEELQEGLRLLLKGQSVSPSLGNAIHLKYDHAIPGFECPCQEPKPENVIEVKFPRRKSSAKDDYKTKKRTTRAIEIQFDKK